jgi:hypothetical protein
MTHRTISSVLAFIALVVNAACSDGAREITATEPPAEVESQLAQNQHNAEYLERMRGEVEPNISYDANSAWHVQESAVLSDEAQSFVSISQAHMKYVTESDAVLGGADFASVAQASASRCFYWGCRIAVSHRVWDGVKDACRPGRATGLGCSRAMKGFIGALGVTGWAATVLPWAVPAYWLVMDWNCRLSGHRGFYINVTWALVTVISPM